MDSVIVFFGDASFQEVESEAAKYGFVGGTVGRGAEHFYLWRYAEEELLVEHEADELQSLHHALGGKVGCAFQLASRHGADARFAIHVVSALMAAFRPSVLDDDFGNLWLPEQVASCAEANPERGIFALRPDA